MTKTQQLATAFLPISCPGCGALTQWIDPNEPGFYTTGRRSVKSFLHDVAPPPAAGDIELESTSEIGEDQTVTATESTEQVENKDSNPEPEGMCASLSKIIIFLTTPFFLESSQRVGE